MQSNGKFVRTSFSNPIRGLGRGAPRRRNKVLRGFVHQVQGVEAPKRAKNLVQGKRKNKVLRGFVHQDRRVRAQKRAKDLVQRKRRNKFLRESLHQVRSRGAAHHRNPTPEILTWCFLRPGTLVSRNERSRCTKCTAASSIYYAFFGAASSKAKPAPPGNAPLRSAAPSPHRRSLLIGEACASRAYIGRLGMRTVKVVPLPGMLST